MKVRSGFVVAFVMVGLLLASGIEAAQGQAREESAEEFNRRAQAEQDAYMRQWEAEQAALRAQQSQPTDTAPESEQPQSNRDRINDAVAEYGLEMDPQTLEQPPTVDASQVAQSGVEPKPADGIEDSTVVGDFTQAAPVEAADETLGTIMFFGLIALGIAAYMIPSIVAFSRRHRYRWPLFAFNLGAAWTGIGWIGCLVWASWPERTAIIDPVLGDATGIDRR